MPKQTIPYSETGYFSKLMCDYLAEQDVLKNFYGRFPKIENFKGQIAEKQQSFKQETRELLANQLKKQYADVAVSEATATNIAALANENTFTITTGHQLNLFTGPLYFLYKIFSVINLSEQLNAHFPEQHFVPVYWMATEDHDFEEINYFRFKGKKVVWDRNDGGAVGELSTEGLEAVAQKIAVLFGESAHGKQLQQWFVNGYVKHQNLAGATRYLGNELFKKYGLVIVDGNDAELKRAFVPYAEKELTEKLAYHEVRATTRKLEALGYPEQVHPREVNLFYTTSGVRERIIEEDGNFFIQDTKLSFSKDEVLAELGNHPERFSPNALLRPLYQEVILPNLCYVGGGGELAYWFQLKAYFERVSVPYPIVLLRNSVLLVSEKQSEKLQGLEVSIERLFQKQHALKTEFTHQVSNINIDFSEQREHLKKQFKELYELAEKTDASFLGAVGAQEKKQLNGLDHLEKRLLKAQKRKLKERLNRLVELQDSLFPNQSLQERHDNFSEHYVAHGERLLQLLKEQLEPLDQEFTILKL